MTKRIFCFMLASLMLVSLFSCKKDEETEVDTVETTAESNGEDEIDPRLEAIDGNGEVIRVLTRQSGLTANYWYDEMNSFGADMGNLVDSKVVERNTVIEQKYDITFQCDPINYNNIDSTIGIQVLSQNTDAESYQLVLPMLVHGFNMSSKGYCYSIDALEYVNSAKPYWREDIYNATTIRNQNYFISGDINTSVYGSSYVCFFNEDLIESYSIDDPYEVVKNGDWTIEKMLELGKDFGNDGGDGVYDNSDSYAVCSGTWVWHCFMYGSNLRFIDKDANDVPYIATKDKGVRESVMNVLSRTVEIMNDPTVAVNMNKTGLTQSSKLFCDGQVLFYFANINNAFIPDDIKDMSQEYGVLPIPKMNEAQNDYYNTVHPHHSSTMTVPSNISTDALPLISSILEDLAYQSYIRIKPAYYDNIITYRSVRNDKSYEMMSYIFANFNIDLGLIMTDTFGYDAEVRNRILTNDANFSSYLTAYTSLWDLALDEIVTLYGGGSK